MSVTYFAAISKRVPAKFTVKKRGGKKKKTEFNKFKNEYEKKKLHYPNFILF